MFLAQLARGDVTAVRESPAVAHIRGSSSLGVFIHSFNYFLGIKVCLKFHTTFIYLETAYSFQEAVSMLPGLGFKLSFGHFDELLNVVRTDMLICTLY